MEEERHGYFDNEFDYLELHRGENVICLYYDFGKLKGIKGILREINPYDSIVIDDKKIKFIGEKTAIKYILLEDKVILYHNYLVDDYTRFIGHFQHLIEKQEECLGYSVILENLKNLKNRLYRGRR